MQNPLDGGRSAQAGGGAPGTNVVSPPSGNVLGFDTGDIRGGKGDKGDEGDDGTNAKGWTGTTYSATYQ